MEVLKAKAFDMLNPTRPGEYFVVEIAMVPAAAPIIAVQALERIPIHRFKL